MPPVLRLLMPSFIAAALSVAGFAQEKNKAYDDPAKVDADYAFQGEYAGEIETDDDELKVGAQVIALGDGKFQLVGYRGGLPGDGWDKSDRRMAEGERSGSTVKFSIDDNTIEVGEGSVVVSDSSGSRRAELKKVDRKSPTLGKKPPEARWCSLMAKTRIHGRRPAQPKTAS